MDALWSSANVRAILTEWHNRERFESSEEQWELWCTIVEQYTSRNLTYDNDRLRGLAGVAEFCEDQLRYTGGFSNGL